MRLSVLTYPDFKYSSSSCGPGLGGFEPRAASKLLDFALLIGQLQAGGCRTHIPRDAPPGCILLLLLVQ